MSTARIDAKKYPQLHRFILKKREARRLKEFCRAMEAAGFWTFNKVDGQPADYDDLVAAHLGIDKQRVQDQLRAWKLEQDQITEGQELLNSLDLEGGPE